MRLDATQEQAIRLAAGVAANGGSLLIAGQAGTGKSTVITIIANAMAERGIPVICIAFTNKAVLRLKEICPSIDCSTAHRLLYDSHVVITVGGKNFEESTVSLAMEKFFEGTPENAVDILGDINLIDMIKRGEFHRTVTPADKSDQKIADLIECSDISDATVIVDEASMLPKKIADDVKRRFSRVIFVGDHRQLPPVEGPDTIAEIQVDHRIELDRIFRTDDGSDIIDRADDARRGELCPDRFVDLPGMIRSGCQMICYTNKDVDAFNDLARSVLGILGEPPKAGEILIAMSPFQAEYLKEVSAAEAVKMSFHGECEKENFEDLKPGDKVFVRAFSRGFTNQTVTATGRSIAGHLEILHRGVRMVIKTQPFWLGGQVSNKGSVSGVPFKFSYAITAHRSQGSEWPNVAVKMVDKESMPWVGESMARRWNYTAVTRAKKKVAVIPGNVAASSYAHQSPQQRKIS